MSDVVLGFGKPAERDATILGDAWFKIVHSGHRNATVEITGIHTVITIADATFITDGHTWTVSRDVFGLVPMRYCYKGGFQLSTRPDFGAGEVNQPRVTAFLLQSRDDGIDDFFVDLFRVRPNETVVFGPSDVKSRRTRKRVSFEPADRTLNETVEELKAQIGAVAPKSNFALALSGGLDSNAFVQSEHEVRPFTMRSRFPSVDESDFVTSICEQHGLTPDWFDIDSVFPLKDRDYFSNPLVAGWGPSFHANAYGESEFFSHVARSTDLPIVTGLAGDHVLDVNVPIVARRAIQTGDLTLLRKLRRQFPKTVARQMLTTPLSKFRRPITEDPFATWVTGTAEPRFTDDQNWASVRWSQLRTWRWERVTRLSDSHARMIGRPVQHPWLSIDLWTFLLTVEPKHLFTDFRLKGVLRRALIGKIPDRVRTAPKTKSLNKVVEFGLGFERAAYITELFIDSELERNDLIDGPAFRAAFEDFRRHCQRASDDEWVPTFPIWQTIAAEIWLQTLQR